MKKAILAALVLLVIPMTLAVSTKNNYLEMKTITGYINGVAFDTITSEGEQDIRVNSGDKIEFIVKIYNNDTRSIPVQIEGMIDEDICDIEDYSSGETVDSESSWTSDKIVCKIPSSTDGGNYDLKLNFLCKQYNSSNVDWRVNDSYQTCIKNRIYYVTVTKEEDTTITTTSPTSTTYILNNMTAACNAFKSSTDACFGYVDKSKTCADELSTVKENYGRADELKKECNDKLVVANNEKTTFENEKNNLQSQISTMITNASCSNMIATTAVSAKSQQSSKDTQMGVFIAALGIVLYLWDKKKKEKSNVSTSAGADMGYDFGNR